MPEIMRIQCFQHAACEGPGTIGDWAAARGHVLTTTHLYAGDPLPEIGTFDLAVIMGGPMNIYQYRDHPWLRAERTLFQALIAAGGRAIGVCLGSQLLADALGARVFQNAHHEVGWFPVRFTDEARARLPFLPAEETVIHWHGDTFELPAGAMRLGASAACPEQGFLWDGRVLGLQFHPEMTPASLGELVAADGDSLHPELFVQTPVELLARGPESFEPPQRLLWNLLDEIFGRAE